MAKCHTLFPRLAGAARREITLAWASLNQLLTIALGIQLGTNLGRVQHFGAYQLPEQVDIANGDDDSKWVRLSMERPAKIHGLAFDVPEYTNKMKTIYGFGVSQDASLQSDKDETDKPPLLPIHVRGPTLPPPEFTNYLQREKTGYSLSTASLNNITALHVRKKMI